MQRGIPILVWEHPGARRVQRWVSGHAAAHDCVHVTVGRLPDGRWFAQRGPEARAYLGEEAARDVAGRLMADRDDWQEVPAEPGVRGGAPPPGWRLSGQRWIRTATGEQDEPPR